MRNGSGRTGETTLCGDVRCTSALRTAYDLARLDDRIEAVVGVDRLANAQRFNPDLLLNFCAHYRGARANDRVAEVPAHVTPYSGSPMETRLRMLIIDAGLPCPEIQSVVQDVRARAAVWLDLAWPDHKIAIEYEGEVHASPEAVLRDAGRYTRLVDDGWRIYRYTKFEVHGEREQVIAQLMRARQRTR